MPVWLAMRILIPVIGLFVGSFANVLIWRIPRKEEWVVTPSHCPKCGKRLTFLDMIPVLSWLFLLGKCRTCKAPISARYPAVELLNALLWLACVDTIGPEPFLIVALALSTTLLVVSFIDWDTGEIPDGTHIFILIVGVLWNIYALVTGSDIWLRNLIGFFSVSLLLLLLSILTKGGVGGGDIKLTAVCGLILGWQNMLLALAVAAILGALAALPVFLIKKLKRSTPIPFGPFLSIGMFSALCWGGDIISTYMKLFLK